MRARGRSSRKEMWPANGGPSEKLAQTNVVMNQNESFGLVVKGPSVDPCQVDMGTAKQTKFSFEF